MPNVLDILAVMISTALIAVLVADNIRIRIKHKNALMSIVQAEIDKMAVLAKLDETIKENEITKSDGFVRFLSESRDVAFSYIETVQEELANFVNKSEHIFDNLADKESKASYERLKDLLPKAPSS